MSPGSQVMASLTSCIHCLQLKTATHFQLPRAVMASQADDYDVIDYDVKVDRPSPIPEITLLRAIPV